MSEPKRDWPPLIIEGNVWAEHVGPSARGKAWQFEGKGPFTNRHLFVALLEHIGDS